MDARQTISGMTKEVLPVVSTPVLLVVSNHVIPAISWRESIEKACMQYYVYILASKRNGTLYVGVTSDLGKRIYEHKNNLVEGFTKQYSVHNLVYFEITESVESLGNHYY